MISSALILFLRVIMYLLIIRAVMSWVVRDYRQPAVQFIVQITDPILKPMRDLFDRMGWNNSGIDFSFMATYLVIILLMNMLARGLF